MLLSVLNVLLMLTQLFMLMLLQLPTLLWLPHTLPPLPPNRWNPPPSEPAKQSTRNRCLLDHADLLEGGVGGATIIATSITVAITTGSNPRATITTSNTIADDDAVSCEAGWRW